MDPMTFCQSFSLEYVHLCQVRQQIFDDKYLANLSVLMMGKFKLFRLLGLAVIAREGLVIARDIMKDMCAPMRQDEDGAAKLPSNGGFS